MLNAGTFESILKDLPADTLQSLKDGVLNHGISYYLWGSVERFFAVLLQIFLSLFVLLGVVKKKFSYVVFAVFIHAAIDFPLTFYRVGLIKQLWMVENYVALVGCVALLMIRK